MRKLHTGGYGLIDSQRWKYMRIFESHELHDGRIRITERLIAKLPWDFRHRVTVGDPLFIALYERFRKRGFKTVGSRETLKIIRVHEVTEALTRGK